MPIGAEAAHCGGGRFVCGKRWVIQPLGTLMAFSNRFASQQCIIAAGAAPPEVPHHLSRVWQLWRTTQRSAKRPERARRDGRQQPHHRTRHEDDRFRRGTAPVATPVATPAATPVATPAASAALRDPHLDRRSSVHHEQK